MLKIADFRLESGTRRSEFWAAARRSLDPNVLKRVGRGCRRRRCGRNRRIRDTGQGRGGPIQGDLRCGGQSPGVFGARLRDKSLLGHFEMPSAGRGRGAPCLRGCGGAQIGQIDVFGDLMVIGRFLSHEARRRVKQNALVNDRVIFGRWGQSREPNHYRKQHEVKGDRRGENGCPCARGTTAPPFQQKIQLNGRRRQTRVTASQCACLGRIG